MGQYLVGRVSVELTEVLQGLGVLSWFHRTDVSGSIGIKKPDP